MTTVSYERGEALRKLSETMAELQEVRNFAGQLQEQFADLSKAASGAVAPPPLLENARGNSDLSLGTARGNSNLYNDFGFSFDGSQKSGVHRDGSCAQDNQSSSSSSLSSPSQMVSKSLNKGKEAESIKLSPLPSVPQFRSWKLALRDEVASASGLPELGFRWICEVEQSSCTIENLADNGLFLLWTLNSRQPCPK